MAFGRRSAASEPEPVVDWRGITEFEITTALRRRAGHRRRDYGRLAVRVPDPAGPRASEALVPCAFFRPAVARPPAASRAFTDEATTRVLLVMEKDRPADGGETHHLVLDADGNDIGLIRRVPLSGSRDEHGWRLEQPGQPPIEAGMRAPSLGARLVANALESVFGSDDDTDANQPDPPGRLLRWHTAEGGRGGERVMTSQANGPVRIEADWIDRRLAIAYAMLLDR